MLKPGGLLWLDVRCQALEADPWAVREAGSAAFYSALHAAMANASATADSTLEAPASTMARCTLPTDELAQRTCEKRLVAQRQKSRRLGVPIPNGSLSLDYGEKSRSRRRTRPPAISSLSGP